MQHKLGVHVSGAVPPRPVTSFGHFGFDDTLLKAIRRSDFTQPTPIQEWHIFTASYPKPGGLQIIFQAVVCGGMPKPLS